MPKIIRYTARVTYQAHIVREINENPVDHWLDEYDSLSLAQWMVKNYLFHHPAFDSGIIYEGKYRIESDGEGSWWKWNENEHFVSHIFRTGDPTTFDVEEETF